MMDFFENSSKNQGAINVSVYLSFQNQILIPSNPITRGESHW